MEEKISARYHARSRSEHEAKPVPLIEDAIADVLFDPKLKGDTLHPNAEGHVRLVEKIYKELQSIGYAGL